MIDICGFNGYMNTTFKCVLIAQMITQASWEEDGSIFALLSGDGRKTLQTKLCRGFGVECVAELFVWQEAQLAERVAELNVFSNVLEARKFAHVVSTLPQLRFVPEMAKQTYGCGEEVAVKVLLKRQNDPKGQFVYAPFFPKVKQGGWFVMVGDGKDLLALKKLSFGQSAKETSVSVVFDAPDEAGAYTVDVVLMSDSYIGIDQKRTLTFRVAE